MTWRFWAVPFTFFAVWVEEIIRTWGDECAKPYVCEDLDAEEDP